MSPPMPDWEPDWSDVVFDHELAAATALACDRLAEAADTAATGRAARGGEALADWRGRFADAFAVGHPLVVDEHHRLADEARRIALALRQASELAVEEQHRRRAERERWHDERERLEAAAAGDGVAT